MARQQHGIAAATLTTLLLCSLYPALAQSSPSTPVQDSQAADALERAEVLNQLVVQLYQAGRYAEAIPLAEEVLQIREFVLGSNHLDVAISLNNLAGLHYAQGDYTATEYLLQRALQITENVLDSNDPYVAILLNNLAELYQDQGDYYAAEPLYQRSLQIVETALGADDSYMARGLKNLAGLYIAQGNYSSAEPLLQRAIQIQEINLGPDHPDLANSLNSLAIVYQFQGNYSAAMSLFQRSLQIHEIAFGINHPSVAAILNNLANLYNIQGNYITALDLHERSLQIWENTRGLNHPLVAISLNGLAETHRVQGNYTEAEYLYHRSLEIQETVLGLSHPDVAVTLNNLAMLSAEQGNYSDAELFLQQALQIDESSFGGNHPNVALGFNNLSVIYQQQGKLSGALHFLARGTDIEELHFGRNLVALNDRQRQAYAGTLFGTTQHAISLHIQIAPSVPGAAELALTTLLRRKGRILDAGTSSRQVLRQNLTPEDQATLDQLTDTQRQLATLTFNPPPNLPPDQYRARLAELEAEANQLESTLARRSAAFRAETAPVDIPAVAAQLPTNSVLVEYVRYRPFNAQEPQSPWGADRYAAYLLFPNGRIEAVDLGPANEIDAAARDFIGLLQDRSTTLRAGARPTPIVEDVQAVTGKMQSLILDPIAPYLSDSDHLLVSPDSQLNLIPFEALQSEVGGPFLIEQYQISYLNSGRDLLKFNVTEPSRAPAVVLANPDYEQASGSPRPPGEGLGERATDLAQIQVGPLPGTAAEAEALRPLLPNARILTEDQATENALKTLQAPRILHIATHGFFLANIDRPDPNSRGGFGLRDFDNPLAPPPGFAIENPLLRSGLALAGFNPRRSGSEDGVLTALEASQLNLFGTQLVVLSACDTGLGDVANGEGVYGLRRAFAIAGAETQLLSLWQVDDFGTQSLMARYYENLTAGMGRSEALREVQLEMIAADDTYSHPYYWAAFILAGDWRSLD